MQRPTTYLMFILCSLVFIHFGTVAQAQNIHPLLVDGTSTIYQRVLTRPGAIMHSSPEGRATSQFPAFQPLYVFKRETGWLQIGPSSNKAPEGWVSEDVVVPWRQNIVAAFTNSAGRERQLMFQTQDDLRNFMNNEVIMEKQKQLIKQSDNGQLESDSGVVAVEPGEFVNIRDQLYIMPILDFIEDVHPANYEETLLMRVASVPLKDAPDAAPAPSTSSNDFDAGVVFVLDTTQSMGPYIARTKTALRKIVEDIRGTDIGPLVNFGVMAFRDNNKLVPGLGYRTRELVKLKKRNDQTPVLAAIDAATKVATVNSPGFNEDSLAGVEDALDLTDWGQGGPNPFDARYIILVTDAGPKGPKDANARSQIGPAELQRDAQGKGVVIMTLHLKTPSGGEANHTYAAAKYRALSRFDQQQYYYPIEGGEETSFEQTVTHLVTALTDNVRIARGEDTVLSPQETGQELVDLGLAMRLSYLGVRQGTQAPNIINGWVSEKATENATKLAFEPRLLVTKNELATMAEFIDKLTTLGDQIRNSEEAANFFTQIQAVIARMAQNPDRLVNGDANTVGSALEFLERLPYKSQLLQINQETWGLSATLRRPIIDGLHQKLVQYRKWLFDSAVWTPLYAGSPDGEYVFAMPFDALP